MMHRKKSLLLFTILLLTNSALKASEEAKDVLTFSAKGAYGLQTFEVDQTTFYEGVRKRLSGPTEPNYFTYVRDPKKKIFDFVGSNVSANGIQYLLDFLLKKNYIEPELKRENVQDYCGAAYTFGFTQMLKKCEDYKEKKLESSQNKEPIPCYASKLEVLQNANMQPKAFNDLLQILKINEDMRLEIETLFNYVSEKLKDPENAEGKWMMKGGSLTVLQDLKTGWGKEGTAFNNVAPYSTLTNISYGKGLPITKDFYETLLNSNSSSQNAEENFLKKFLHTCNKRGISVELQLRSGIGSQQTLTALSKMVFSKAGKTATTSITQLPGLMTEYGFTKGSVIE